MLGPAYFLDGDSFPGKSHYEAVLRPRLEPAFADWIGQREILNRTSERDFSEKIERRLELLEKLIPTDEEAAGVVLIGRSSGGRVASLFAMRRAVAAVICLGYPFRNPQIVLELDRFAHLADISVPTLILQGVRDLYGGAEITETYALSASVAVKLVNTDHEFDLPSSEWDALGETMLRFCDSVNRRLPVEGSRFDEAFYLSTYPDVAKAVAEGAWVSGHQHFNRFGRQERRRFRLLLGN